MVRIMLSKKELLELHEDNADIYKRSMVNLYQIRPYEFIIDKLCCTSFLKRYQLQQKQIENDSQPDEVVDEVVIIASVSLYPKTLKLSSGVNSRRQR